MDLHSSMENVSAQRHQLTQLLKELLLVSIAITQAFIPKAERMPLSATVSQLLLHGTQPLESAVALIPKFLMEKMLE